MSESHDPSLPTIQGVLDGRTSTSQMAGYQSFTNPAYGGATAFTGHEYPQCGLYEVETKLHRAQQEIREVARYLALNEHRDDGADVQKAIDRKGFLITYIDQLRKHKEALGEAAWFLDHLRASLPKTAAVQAPAANIPASAQAFNASVEPLSSYNQSYQGILPFGTHVSNSSGYDDVSTERSTLDRQRAFNNAPADWKLGTEPLLPVKGPAVKQLSPIAPAFVPTAITGERPDARKSNGYPTYTSQAREFNEASSLAISKQQVDEAVRNIVRETYSYDPAPEDVQILAQWTIGRVCAAKASSEHGVAGPHKSLVEPFVDRRFYEVENRRPTPQERAQFADWSINFYVEYVMKKRYQRSLSSRQETASEYYRRTNRRPNVVRDTQGDPEQQIHGLLPQMLQRCELTDVSMRQASSEGNTDTVSYENRRELHPAPARTIQDTISVRTLPTQVARPSNTQNHHILENAPRTASSFVALKSPISTASQPHQAAGIFRTSTMMASNQKPSGEHSRNLRITVGDRSQQSLGMPGQTNPPTSFDHDSPPADVRGGFFDNIREPERAQREREHLQDVEAELNRPRISEDDMHSDYGKTLAGHSAFHDPSGALGSLLTVPSYTHVQYEALMQSSSDVGRRDDWVWTAPTSGPNTAPTSGLDTAPTMMTGSQLNTMSNTQASGYGHNSSVDQNGYIRDAQGHQSRQPIPSFEAPRPENIDRHAPTTMRPSSNMENQHFTFRSSSYPTPHGQGSFYSASSSMARQQMPMGRLQPSGPQMHMGPPSMHMRPPSTPTAPPSMPTAPPSMPAGPASMPTGPLSMPTGPHPMHAGPPPMHAGPPSMTMGPPPLPMGQPPHASASSHTTEEMQMVPVAPIAPGSTIKMTVTPNSTIMGTDGSAYRVTGPPWMLRGRGVHNGQMLQVSHRPLLPRPFGPVHPPHRSQWF